MWNSFARKICLFSLIINEIIISVCTQRYLFHLGIESDASFSHCSGFGLWAPSVCTSRTAGCSRLSSGIFCPFAQGPLVPFTGETKIWDLVCLLLLGCHLLSVICFLPTLSAFKFFTLSFMFCHFITQYLNVDFFSFFLSCSFFYFLFFHLA